MSIRQRLTLSFAVILVLFFVNLVIFFWGSQRRSAALDQLEHAVNRQLKIQALRQQVSEVKSQIGIWNQITPDGIGPEVSRDLEVSFQSIAREARELEALSPAAARDAVHQFRMDCQALTARWTEFIQNAGKDEAKAITALSGDQGADHYAEAVLTKHLPALERAEEKRITAARLNNGAVLRLTRGTTVGLFLA
jgi:hypothetical protein